MKVLDFAHEAGILALDFGTEGLQFLKLVVVNMTDVLFYCSLCIS